MFVKTVSHCKQTGLPRDQINTIQLSENMKYAANGENMNFILRTLSLKNTILHEQQKCRLILFTRISVRLKRLMRPQVLHLDVFNTSRFFSFDKASFWNPQVVLRNAGQDGRVVLFLHFISPLPQPPRKLLCVLKTHCILGILSVQGRMAWGCSSSTSRFPLPIARPVVFTSVSDVAFLSLFSSACHWLQDFG